MKSHATIEVHCMCNALLLPTICNILHSDERSANGQPVGRGQSRTKGKGYFMHHSRLESTLISWCIYVYYL